jgi:hypothetical protein
MWEKDLRINIITFIYTLMFCDASEINSDEVNWYLDEYFTAKKTDIDEKIDKIKNNSQKMYPILNLFLSKKDIILKFISQFAKDWSKTSLISQSVLIAFCLELNKSESENLEQNELNIKKIISLYLDYVENYSGKENVPTVHAILLKLMEVKNEIQTF